MSIPGVFSKLNEAPDMVTSCYIHTSCQSVLVQLGIILHRGELHNKTVLLFWELVDRSGMEIKYEPAQSAQANQG